MKESGKRPSPLSVASEWVARITGIALVMFLPGVGGQRLDEYFGTSFFTLGGFVLGFVIGMVALLATVRVR